MKPAVEKSEWLANARRERRRKAARVKRFLQPTDSILLALPSQLRAEIHRADESDYLAIKFFRRLSGRWRMWAMAYGGTNVPKLLAISIGIDD